MSYYHIILKAHSGIAYLALITLAIAAVNSIIGLITKRAFKDTDRKLALFALIFAHLQLLGGIVLYFISPKVVNIGEAMKNSTLRLYALEHPLINIIAIALITIAWSKHKKTPDSSKKFRLFAIFYSIALLLILSRIPWNVWP